MTSVASKNLKFLAVLGLLVSSVFLLTQSAFAAVTIANQTGTVKITTPDGQVTTVDDPNLHSGIGVISRVDYGVKTWTQSKPVILDLNLA